MKTVRAGMLRHIITIQRPTESQGILGDVVEKWIFKFRSRSFVKPLTGGEWFITEHLLNTVDHQIVIRDPRSTSFTPKDRIIFGDRIFDIIKILNFEERGMHLNMLVKERLDEKYTAPNRRLLESGDYLLLESSDFRLLEK